MGGCCGWFQAGKHKEKGCCSLGWEAVFMAVFMLISYAA